eukprot:COSAG06_NODE_6908_length_2721_cov_7.473303_2_plen_163_part_00
MGRDCCRDAPQPRLAAAAGAVRHEGGGWRPSGRLRRYVWVAAVLCLLLAAKSVATVLCSCLLLLNQSRLFYAILCYRFHRKLFLEPRNRFRFLSELDAHASDWTLTHECALVNVRVAFRLRILSCHGMPCLVLSCLVSSRLQGRARRARTCGTTARRRAAQR